MIIEVSFKTTRTLIIINICQVITWKCDDSNYFIIKDIIINLNKDAIILQAQRIELKENKVYLLCRIKFRPFSSYIINEKMLLIMNFKIYVNCI